MKKILIANRGEIACRVMRTARRMGIRTVAVYSEADREALHVRSADEAYPIGPSPSAKSYLVVENIVRAIEQSGADAVHPGYGFLSENTNFCRILQERGVTFIGPDPHAITAMGDKIASKRLAAESGVNTIPGHSGEVENADEAVRIAREIGYPVMIKASAGGGGKGMRIARNDDEARSGWSSATKEGLSYFGDARVLMEKYIESPRHIEIQLIGDRHGNVLYLNERECSIQRRHQKVIEEAPSSFLDPATRAAMGQQAVALGKAVNYVSAGTVEFVVGPDKKFYFLEMNTRLQVEHPVTEMTTGLDLVELMIRVARGEPLPLKQEEVPLRGWAMESRIYAEDPYRNNLPSVGRLVHYRPPVAENVRVDTGVFEGGEVSIFYDPMIAKLITYGKDRAEAIQRMREALDGYLIEGPRHNIDFLNALYRHPRFLSGNITTKFIEEEYPDGFQGVPISQEDRELFAATAAAIEQKELGIFQDTPKRQVLVVTVDGEAVPLTIGHNPGSNLVCIAEERTIEMADNYRPGDRMVSVHVSGMLHTFQVQRLPEGYLLTKGGTRATVIIRTPKSFKWSLRLPKRKPKDTSNMLTSPMPGLVLQVLVTEGQTVPAGEILCILEAMKMENVMRAEKDVVVKTLHVEPGDTVEADAPLMEFVKEEGEE
ncbi:MAG: acetyl/propionyl/methylcrotonyl-CoA carboxylase subunit alpha [Magnetococcales bacterium]|nr:acetyl/propionyl/methylcrotonyl-CoA carboxylase subunit alpha [Magnetococcales bacterium]MBF0157349.1 acetyl/propionyl/methylcrotonyl-CoA carboxylase subunit alpha [Magnetococcales bacterium]